MSVSIKLQHKEDVRRVTVSQTISYNEIIELTKSLFSNLAVDWEKLSFKYVDNENDLCSVTGELELREAFTAKKQEVLRLELCFRKPNKVAPTSPTFVLLEKLANCAQPMQPQQPSPQPRKCWPERINQKRMQIIGFHEEAIALMDQKKYEEAKALFTKQVEMLNCPWKKSVPLYNIACCEALQGNVDASLATLAQAVNCGYRNVQHIESDEDLKILHGLDAFEVLLSELRSNPPQQKKRECRWNARFARCNEGENNSEISTKSTKKSELIEIKPAETEVKVHEAEVKPDETKLDEVKTEEVNPVLEIQPEVVPVSVEKPASPYQAELTSLLQMGFSDEEKNLNALKLTNGDLSQAVVLLLR